MPDSIPVRQQFAAVAWLRWRLFANGFRRKGGTGELVARIIVFPIAIGFVLGPTLAAFAAARASVTNGHLEFLTGVFWGIFLLQIIVSINISPPGLSFDPESLIRYPLAFPRYLVIRLFLGLLSVSTIAGTIALLGAATGITVANHALAPVAFAAALALALCNMLFVRMVFAWVDRWLSTRRARELFTVLIFAFSIGIQYVNVTFNNLGHRPDPAAQEAKIAAALRLYGRVEPYLHRLPPGLAGSAVLRNSESAQLAALSLIFAILLFAAFFLAIFAWRMQREYRGENLSEAAKSPATSTGSLRNGVRTVVPHLGRAPIATEAGEPSFPAAPPALPSVVLACLEKEWISVRRNPAQFYGLLMPLAMVFIFAGRLGRFSMTGMIFPAAVAYSVLGIAALAYNILGLDASGVQFYFIAPVRFRSVILGKNLFGFCLTVAQLVLIYGVIAFTAGTPPVLITLSTVLWAVFACLANATIGNMRSITAPKKMDPSKLSRKQASQLSALISVGLMLVIGGIGFGLIALSQFLDIPWLPIPILLALAVGAFALYAAGLAGIDNMALSRRETLIEELSKAS